MSTIDERWPDTEPHEFAYTYVNFNNPFVAWSLYRGVILTPDVLNQRGFVSSLMMTMLSRSPDGQFVEAEIALEKERSINFPQMPSRLSSIFAFESREAAEKGIPEMGLRGGTLVGIRPMSMNYTCKRVDSTWLTYAQSMPYEAKKFAKSYWSGEFERDEKSFPELILQGRFIVHGREVRQKAYEVVKECAPTVLWMLELARLGAAFGTDLGNSAAFLTLENHLGFLINFTDKEATKTLQMARDRKKIDPTFQINEEDLQQFMNLTEFQMPDFRDLVKATPKNVTNVLEKLSKILT